MHTALRAHKAITEDDQGHTPGASAAASEWDNPDEDIIEIMVNSFILQFIWHESWKWKWKCTSSLVHYFFTPKCAHVIFLSPHSTNDSQCAAAMPLQFTFSIDWHDPLLYSLPLSMSCWHSYACQTHFDTLAKHKQPAAINWAVVPNFNCLEHHAV